MKSVSCFLFVFATFIYIKEIAGQILVKLSTADHRLENADATTYWKYFSDDAHGTHASFFQIGTSKQNISVQYSTTADTSWIFSKRYDSCDLNRKEMLKIRTFYNPSKSIDYISRGEDDARVLSNYTKGLNQWVFGYLAKDLFHPPLPFHTVSIVEKFIEAKRASPRFALGTSDGAISLQYNPRDEYDNFVGKICKKFPYDNAFSFWFPRLKSGISQGLDGELQMCQINYIRMMYDTLQYTPDISHGAWRIKFTHLKVLINDEYITLTKSKPQATFDSTTNILYGPADPVEQFYTLVNATSHPKFSNKKTINCHKRKDLPVLSFQIQGESYELNGVDYTIEYMSPIQGQDNFCEILIRPAEIDHWILGETFFRVAFVVFDIRRQSIGFGRWRELS